MATRPYRLKERAVSQQATRQRIVDATVELHRTVGPARTTIAAIAARAGVQRLTVYRHFPEPRDLFQACGARFVQQHPPPDLAAWARVADPHERLAGLVYDVYLYYSDTHDMRANVERDAPELPDLAEAASGFARFLQAATNLLAADGSASQPRSRRVRAAVAHALAFSTWRSLVLEGGLSNAEAVDLMKRLVECAAAEGPG